jgi:NADH:ubiquinone oxidoreductase subunit 4 (subunit M)
MWHFIRFLLFSLITFGIYPLYFYVTRQEETNELLKEIRDELRRRKND